MNKKILLGIMTIGLIAMLAGTGIFAYFSDTETSGNNIFQAGTIKLDVGDVIITGADLSNLKPGDTITGELTVENIGSLDGYLYGRSYYTEIADPDPASDLGDVLTVTSWTDPDATIAPDIPLSTFASGVWMPYGALTTTGTADFSITIVFDTDAGNEYQGDRINVRFELFLNQIDAGP